MLEASSRRRLWETSHFLSPRQRTERGRGQAVVNGPETLINAHVLEAERSIQRATLEDAKKYLILCLFFFFSTPGFKISDVHQVHYISLAGKYPLLCFMNKPCFVSLCPKMLLVRTVHMRTTSKAGNTADRRQAAHRKWDRHTPNITTKLSTGILYKT